MNNPFIKYGIAVLIVVALAEVAPEAVNSILVLVLIGMILMNAAQFEGLTNLIGSLGK